LEGFELGEDIFYGGGIEECGVFGEEGSEGVLVGADEGIDLGFFEDPADLPGVELVIGEGGEEFVEGLPGVLEGFGGVVGVVGLVCDGLLGGEDGGGEEAGGLVMVGEPVLRGGGGSGGLGGGGFESVIGAGEDGAIFEEAEDGAVGRGLEFESVDGAYGEVGRDAFTAVAGGFDELESGFGLGGLPLVEDFGVVGADEDFLGAVAGEGAFLGGWAGVLGSWAGGGGFRGLLGLGLGGGFGGSGWWGGGGWGWAAEEGSGGFFVRDAEWCGEGGGGLGWGCWWGCGLGFEGGLGCGLLGFGVRFIGGLEELFAELDGFEVEEFPLAEDGAFGGSGEVFEAVFAVEESSEEGKGGLAASAGGFGVDDAAFLDEDAALDFGVKDFEDAGVTGGALEFDELEEGGVGGEGGIALFGAPFEDFAERVMDALHAGEAVGFFEEEDRAVIEGVDAVFIGDGAGEEYFRDGGVVGVELADEFGAADAGHIHIDDDEVDILGLDEGVGLVGVRGGEDGPGFFAEAGEDIADHLEERGFVIDE
jgi:hypothetical protein